MTTTVRPRPPTVGMVWLSCPKAPVGSDRIPTTLRSGGYALSADCAGANVVLVNSCGFRDSAK